MRILITGGAGYIGSHTVRLLQRSSPHRITVFDNLSTGHTDAIPNTHLIIGDLSDKDCIERCFQQNQFDIVMHFASHIDVAESVKNPAKYYRNNLINTINLLDVMRTHHVNYFIFSSTAAVYGNPIATLISIRHPKNPINPYGKSKAMMEDIIEDYHRAYGLHYIILRYFNAAGADPSGDLGERHDPETHLIPLALQVALGKKSVLNVYGTDYDTSDGTCIRDYVHVCDIAAAHQLAAEYLLKKKQSRCFNLGTQTGHSVKAVIDTVEKITQQKLNIQWQNRRAGDAPILVADSIEAMHVLQWRPVYTALDELIQHAWNYAKKSV